MLLHPEVVYFFQLRLRNRLIQQVDRATAALETAISALADTAQGEFRIRGTSDLTAASEELRRASTGDAPGAVLSVSTRLARFLGNSLARNVRTRQRSFVRPAPQARKELGEALAVAVPAVALLAADNPAGVGALLQLDPALEVLRARVRPALMASAKLRVDQAIRDIDSGDFLKDPQKHLASLLAIPGVLKAVENSRDPRDPVVGPKTDSSDEGPFPAGSSLSLTNTGYIPASVTSTRTPGDLPEGAILDYGANGSGSTPLTIPAAGRPRLVPPRTRTGSYTITVPQLLLRFDDLVYKLPLTTGTRTAAQVISDLETAWNTIFAVVPDVTFEDLRDRLYISSDSSHTLGLPPSGAAVRHAYLQTDTIVFPAALAGTVLNIDVKTDSDAGEFKTRSHTFGPGPFNTIGDVVGDLFADAVFSDNITYDMIGDALRIRLSINEYGAAIALSDPPGTAVTPLLLQFVGDLLMSGSEFVESSAVAELGFDPNQPPVTYYGVSELAELINEQQVGPIYGPNPELVATGTRETVLTGRGALDGTGTFTTDQDTSALEEGDLVFSSAGVGVVDAVGEGVFSVTFQDSFAPGHDYDVEVVAERLVLTAVYYPDDPEVGEPDVEVFPSTAAAPLGLPVGRVAPSQTGYSISGTMEGDSVAKTQDPSVLGVPDNAVVDLETSTIEAPARPAYRAFERLLQRLVRDPLYETVSQFADTAARAESAAQLGELRSRAIDDSMRDLFQMLNLLDTASSGRASALAALQRLGVEEPPQPARTLKTILTSYVPEVDATSTSVGRAALGSLETAGFDRAADMLVQGRYRELAELTAAPASRAGRVTSALQQAGQDFIDQDDPRRKKRYVNSP